MRDYSGGPSKSDALMFGDGQRFEMAQSGVGNIRRKLGDKSEKQPLSPHPREKSLQLSKIITPGLVLAVSLYFISNSVFNVIRLTFFYDPEFGNSLYFSNDLLTIAVFYFILGIAILYFFYK